MATELAKAYVQIIPSAQGIQGSLTNILDGEAASAGASFGNTLLGGAKGALAGAGRFGIDLFKTSVTEMTKFGATSVEVGKQFDASMSQVAATMGVSVDEISELREYAQQMGASTMFSASQAADALNYMALAGYDAETSMQMLPNVLNLAAAGNIDLAYASDMVTDASSALGLSIDETTELVDMMAQTSSKSNTSISQLGEAILTVGGTAKNLAGGTNEMNTALGILADNGVKGAEGGTALRNIILSLSAPTDKAADAMLRFGGMEALVYDEAGNMRNLNDIFTDLNDIMGDMTQKERTELLSTLFNKVDLKSVSALLANTVTDVSELSKTVEASGVEWEKYADTYWMANEGLESLVSEGVYNLKTLGTSAEELQEYFQFEYDLSAEDAIAVIQTITDHVDEYGSRWDELSGMIDDATGAAQKMSDTQMDNLAGSIKYFESALEGAQIVISDQLTPTIRDFVDFGTDAISRLTEAFNEGGFSGAMEALGGIISDGLAMLLEAVPDVVAAGAELLTALVGGLSENADIIAGAVVEIANTIVSTILELLPTILDTGLTIIENLALGIAKALPGLISTLVDTLVNLVSVIIQHLPLFLDAAMQIITALATGIFQALPTLLEQLPGLVQSLVETLLKEIPVIIQAGVELLTALIDDLPTIINTIVTVLPEIVEAIISTLMDNLPALMEAGTTLFLALIENMPEIEKQIIACIPTLIDNMLQTFADLIVKFEDMGGEIMMGLADGIAKSVEAVIRKSIDSLDGVVDSIKEYFGIASPSKMFEEFGGYLDMGLAIGIDKNADLPIDAMDEMSAELSRSYDVESEINRMYSFEPAAETGDITIPVYIGDEEIETLVVSAQDRNQYRSGGR